VLAGLGVAAAMVTLAVRVHGRARVLLIGGIVLLLAAALGLEVVQGRFMAAGNEGIGFALGYHVEEFGENLGGLLMIGAAAAMIRIERHGGFVLRYVEHPKRSRRLDPGPLRTSAGLVTTAHSRPGRSRSRSRGPAETATRGQ
jgi:hypothetical protein